MNEEIDQELDRLLRTGITVAGQVGERVARIRANQARLEAERDESARRSLEQATREEIGAARRVYGGVHDPRWFNGEPADVQRRFGAALVTAHGMAGVDPVARVAEQHLLREARARYTDADAWMQAAVLGYTEAMAEQADRDEEQARADRAAATMEQPDDPERAGEALVMNLSEDDLAAFDRGADRAGGEVKPRLTSDPQVRRAETLAEGHDAHGLDDIDRALDEWSRELGDRNRGADLENRAHEAGARSTQEQAREVAEVVEEGFPVQAGTDHAAHIGKVRAKTTGGRSGDRSRGRTQDRGR